MKGKIKTNRTPVILVGSNGKMYKKELKPEGLKSLTDTTSLKKKEFLAEELEEVEETVVSIPETVNHTTVISPIEGISEIEQETTQKIKSSDKKLVWAGIGLGLLVLIFINN